MEDNIVTLVPISSIKSTPKATLYSRIKSGTLVAYEVKGQLYLNPDEVKGWGEIKKQRARAAQKSSSLWQEVQRLHELDYSDIAIAEKTGRSRERIRVIRNGLGLEPNARRPRLPKGTYNVPH